MHVTAAAGLVTTGRSVSLSLPINKVAGPDNPRPALHYMIHRHESDHPEGAPRFATDFLASEFHGDSFTHIDALCHVSYQGTALQRQAGIERHRAGGAVAGHHRLRARHRGPRRAPGHPPPARGSLAGAGRGRHDRRARGRGKGPGRQAGQGDILLFRTGHHRRRLELGPWNSGYDGEGKAGLHVTALQLLHERKVAVFLPDGDGETVPSQIEGIAYPIHVLQIVAMGMVCADSLQFEELVKVCEEEKRWEFMVVACPLRLPGGTGSLFNPIAIF